MADNTYGVYISMRNADGVLVSSSRATWPEVLNDLDGLYMILDKVEELESASQETTVTEAEAVSNVVAAFPQVAATPVIPQQTAAPMYQQEQAPASAFKSCEKCGHLKDKWVAPGTSKRTGKSYPGFYGCSNPSCR